MAPHNPQGPVSTAASIEFGFATPSYVVNQVNRPRASQRTRSRTDSGSCASGASGNENGPQSIQDHEPLSERVKGVEPSTFTLAT